MTWKVEFDEHAAKELRKLDHQVQREIIGYLRNRIASDEDPRRFGTPLAKDLVGLWRYRVRGSRIICNIEDSTLVVLVVRVSHRKSVYK